MAVGNQPGDSFVLATPSVAVMILGKLSLADTHVYLQERQLS
jgi:hypothetical protein